LSFDIVVLHPKPDTSLLRSIEEVEQAFPLGPPEEIRRQCDLAIPGINWTSNSGVYRAAEGFAVEFSIPDEVRPSSLHLSLHYGTSWESGGNAAFDRMIHLLYESYRWQSFAVSDNSSLLLEEAS
jgi:hypothetical protein